MPFPINTILSFPISNSVIHFMGFFFHLITLTGISLGLILLVNIIKIFGIRLAEKKRRYHPIAGTVFHQLANFHRMHHYMTDLAAKHRTYRLLCFPRSEAIYTSDPINVEHILKTNFPNYARVILHQPLEFYCGRIFFFSLARGCFRSLVGFFEQLKVDKSF